MKGFILLLLISICWEQSVAQNWKPFVFGETYNYQNMSVIGSAPTVTVQGNCAAQYSNAPTFPNLNLNLSSFVDLQIWIDSIDANNSDSIYYFNKKIEPCDTCSMPAIVVNQSLDYGLFNDFYTQNSIGQHIFHYNGDSLIIDIFQGVNSVITSDYSASLSAEVIEAGWDTVYLAHNTPAVEDSIRLIRYYNNVNAPLYEVSISKNHGIYAFKDIAAGTNTITLMGIESRDFGIVQVDWKRSFDFNVGDVFCYHDAHQLNVSVTHRVSKAEILNRQDVGQDTIIYTVNYKLWWKSVGFPVGGGTGNDTVDVIVTRDRVSNLYTNGADNISRINQRDNELDLTYYPNGAGGPQGIVSKNFLYDWSTATQYKYTSYGYNFAQMFPTTWGINSPHFTVNPNSDVYYYNDNTGESLTEIYGLGLGLVYRYENFFEGYSCHTLFGYIKGADTVGVITPNNLFLQIPKLPNKLDVLNVEVYPNPVNDYLTIDIDELPSMDEVNFTIRNINGQVIKNSSYLPQKSYILSVENFNPGIYLLELKNDTGLLLGFKKFVVN